MTLSLFEDQSEIDPKSQDLPVSDGNGGITNFKIDSIRTSNMEATVVAQDGLTIAVGGLISDESTTIERRIPGLHRLPMVGNLFRQFQDNNSKNELILLITPHVITTPMEGHYKSEARIKALSDHPNAATFEKNSSSLGTAGKVLPGKVEGDDKWSEHEWDETEQPKWRSISDEADSKKESP